ncbi:MAG: peptidylprolyl isomerase [Acidobacteriota bacterium]
MSKSWLFVVLMFCSFAVACSPAAKEAPASPTPSPKPEAAKPAVSPDEEIAVFDTSYGRFKMRFFEDLAPKHVAHFKKLVKEGFYDGLAFHRAIPKGIIQGGDPTTRGNDRSQWGAGLPGQPTVPAEFSQRPFVRGIVGAARRGNDINSATSQFFICLDDRPEWNGEYTVFGEVYRGITTVEIISNVPTEEGNGQKMREKVVIYRVHLEKAGDSRRTAQ